MKLFALNMFKIFMIVDDSFDRLTERMIVDNCCPPKVAGSAIALSK